MTEHDRRRCKCGHTFNQHQNDDQGCWGHDCLTGPQEFRCQSWTPVAMAAPPTSGRRRGPAISPEQSHLAVAEEKLRVGTDRYMVYRAILMKREHGMTDEELEHLLVKKHQTVSAARNTLMNDGLIVDSGRKRDTTSGREATVWISWVLANP